MMKNLLLFFLLLFASGNIFSQKLAGELEVLDFDALPANNPITGNPWMPGEMYHLVFVTDSTRNATSTNIADYNTFAQDVANGSPLNLGDHTSWKVIGSTEAVNARTNTGTTAAGGIPIILVDGFTVIADDYDDLWDGAGDIIRIKVDENGSIIPGDPPPTDGPRTFVWTGTLPNGNAETDRWLGSGEIVTRGEVNANTAGRWVQQFGESQSVLRPFYALSGPLTICVQDTYVVDADMDHYIDGNDPSDTLFSCEVPDPIGDYVLISTLLGPEVDCDPTDPNLTFPGNSCDDGLPLTVDDFVNDDCVCVGGREIPTLSQWGVIVLSMIMLIFGIVAVRRRKTIFS